MFVGVLRCVEVIEVVTKTVQGKARGSWQRERAMARVKPRMAPPAHNHFVLQLKAFLEECLGHRRYPL